MEGDLPSLEEIQLQRVSNGFSDSDNEDFDPLSFENHGVADPEAEA